MHSFPTRRPFAFYYKRKTLNATTESVNHKNFAVFLSVSWKQINYFLYLFFCRHNQPTSRLNYYSLNKILKGKLAHVRYIKMLTRLHGFLIMFLYFVCVLKFLLGIARQWSPEKCAILSLKPRSHVRILIYQTWAIKGQFSLKMLIHWRHKIRGRWTVSRVVCQC